MAKKAAKKVVKRQAKKVAPQLPVQRSYTLEVRATLTPQRHDILKRAMQDAGRFAHRVLVMLDPLEQHGASICVFSDDFFDGLEEIMKTPRKRKQRSK